MPEQFAVDDLDVTVEESIEELSYTFRSPGRPGLAGLPPGCSIGLIAIPLGLAAITWSALAQHGAERPEWVVALSWLLVGQLLAMAFLGLQPVVESVYRRLVWGRTMMEMVFTREAFIHRTGSAIVGPVCPLEDVRGFCVFVSTGEVKLLADMPLPRQTAPDPTKPPLSPDLASIPPAERPVPERMACFSVVVGEKRQTHGIFGGFTPEGMTALAHDLHRRLATFRKANMLDSPLDPVEVMETTEEEAANRSHTLPPQGSRSVLQRILWGGFMGVVAHRGLCTLWCLALFAGLIGSALLVVGTPLAGVLLVYFVVGCFHAVLLYAVWKGPDNKSDPPLAA